MPAQHYPLILAIHYFEEDQEFIRAKFVRNDHEYEQFCKKFTSYSFVIREVRTSQGYPQLLD